MKAAILSPRARRELLAAVRWIAKDNPSAANSLLDAIDRVSERIGKHPQIGVVRASRVPAPHRFLTLTDFPYIIVL
jgi:toxin ParE1/3/4